MAKRQQSGVATITACTPSNHNRCTYSFSLQGKSYTGEDSPSFDSAKGAVGRQVPVYYDAANPAVNALGDFSASARQDFGFATVCSIGICAVVGFIILAKRHPQALPGSRAGRRPR